MQVKQVKLGLGFTCQVLDLQMFEAQRALDHLKQVEQVVAADLVGPGVAVLALQQRAAEPQQLAARLRERFSQCYGML